MSAEALFGKGFHISKQLHFKYEAAYCLVKYHIVSLPGHARNPGAESFTILYLVKGSYFILFGKKGLNPLTPAAPPSYIKIPVAYLV